MKKRWKEYTVRTVFAALGGYIAAHRLRAAICALISIVLCAAVALLAGTFTIWDAALDDYAFNNSLFLLSLALPFAIGALLLAKPALSLRCGRLYAASLMVTGPIVSYLVSEYVYYTEVFHHKIYVMMALGLLFHYALCLFVYALTNRPGVAVVCSGTVFYAFSLLNYAVTVFRGSPIMPNDLYAIETALAVADRYTLPVNCRIVFSLLVMTLLAVAALQCTYHVQSRVRWPLRAAALAASIGLMVSYFGFDLFGRTRYDMDLFTQSFNSRTYGTAVSFFENAKYTTVQKPAGYSAAAVRSIKANYLPQTATAAALPNIIVVMNESFCDYDAFGNDLGLSGPIAPVFQALCEHSPHGEILVSARGGGTCNTEFEFLTSNSMLFLPEGALPFQQYIAAPDTPSIVSLLDTLGYETVGMHPANGRNWNRAAVYPNFGFDQVLFLNDFVHTGGYRDFVSDQSTYQEVIRMFEEKPDGQPIFVFDVTIQNHASYERPIEGDKNNLVSFLNDDFPLAHNYLNLMRESDAAIQTLIDFIDNCAEPTILLFFGDHQPGYIEETFEERALLDTQASEIAQLQKKYVTQFVLYANFEIEAQDYGLTSPNYLAALLFQSAGLPLPPYYQFLLAQRQTVPAMNSRGYVGADGVFYARDDDAYAQGLADYGFLVYDNLFDANRSTDWFYGFS